MNRALNAALKLIIRTGDALSQFTNALLLAGDPNESISGRAYRCGWRRTEAVIDWLFSPFQSNHCLKAYTNDVERARRLVAEHEARGAS